jgi:hypothetical protein
VQKSAALQKNATASNLPNHPKMRANDSECESSTTTKSSAPARLEAA